MSLFDVVKSWFSGSGSGRLYIIDGAQLVGSGSSDRLSPRDQVHVLQMLSRYAQKEAISIQVAFEGRPLREVAHGGEYGGVTVFFADKQAALQDMILDLVRSGARRQKVVLVTAQRQIEEKAVSAGARGAAARRWASASVLRPTSRAMEAASRAGRATECWIGIAESVA